MAEKVEFELVSPEELVFSDPVDMVVVPGADGDFGVLRGHAALISSVRPGVVAVFEGREVKKRYFVAGGFAEVTPERCTVIAEEACGLADLVADDARQAIEEARAALSAAQNEMETQAAEQALAAAEARLRAATDPPYGRR